MKHSVLSIHSSVKYASMNRLTIDLILCYLKECSGHRTFEFQTLKPKKSLMTVNIGRWSSLTDKQFSEFNS